MVIGIGIDIVEVERIRQALQDGEALARRVFTERELTYCRERKNQFQHFAGRFAAKEAAMKALGTGWQEGIRWRDVEVIPGDLGQPELVFHGKAEELFTAKGGRRSHVTITHASAYAVAAVVLEGEPGSARDGLPRE
ncbi:MAG: holo-[acyl-carrier-protein] synthase [Acidobacteriota bacterium]